MGKALNRMNTLVTSVEREMEGHGVIVQIVWKENIANPKAYYAIIYCDLFTQVERLQLHYNKKKSVYPKGFSLYNEDGTLIVKSKKSITPIVEALRDFVEKL